MKKKLLILGSLVVMTFALALGGCSVNEDSYQLVFGASSKSLTPAIGNTSYEKQWLDPEAHQKEEDLGSQTNNGVSSNTDNYVDPTAGLGCAN